MYCKRSSSRSPITILKAPQPRGSAGVECFGRLPFVVGDLFAFHVHGSPQLVACWLARLFALCLGEHFGGKVLLVYIWYQERAILTQAWGFFKERVLFENDCISFIDQFILRRCKYIKLILSLCSCRQWSETSQGKNTPVHPWKLHFSLVWSCISVVFLLFISHLIAPKGKMHN